jgi:alcohol dehydrogenase
MTAWSFHNPVRVEFGEGHLGRLAELCDFQRAVLITTPGFTRRGTVDRVRELLGSRLLHVHDAVQPNPDFDSVGTALTDVAHHRPDGLVALGGGSVIDTAKAVARKFTEPAPALPVLAIPTTSGTGAEVTPFATVWDFQEKKKHSVSGVDLYPRLALLDPALTFELPWQVTLTSGLDAISHGFESTWNRNASPASLALAACSLQLSLAALPVLADDLADRQARSDMMQASVLAGIAISQTRTALAHSISYPLTAHLGLEHGLACSFTLPELLRFNIPADDGRLARLSSVLGYASAGDLAQGLEELFAELGLSRLLSARIRSRDSMLELSGKMITPGRAENNLRDASMEDVRRIVLRAGESLTASSQK